MISNNEKIYTAGKVAEAAYGIMSPGSNYTLLQNQKTDSGFEASVYVNSITKEIWVGIAGTNQYPTDVLTWTNTYYGMSFNTK